MTQRTPAHAPISRALWESSPLGFYVRSEAGQLMEANPAMLRLLGLDSLAAAGELRWDDLVSPVAPEHRILAHPAEPSGGEAEIVVRRPDGTERTLLDTFVVLDDPSTGSRSLHGVVVDVSEHRQLVDQLREQSTRDPLTGLYNRRQLRVIEERLSASGAIWGAIVIDVDGFKLYNDRYGHAAGDEVLVRLSRFLNQCVRSEDSVVRFGGDEFVVVVAGSIAEATEIVAHRIQSRAPIASPAAFTLGYAVREGQEPLSETIERADERLIQVRIRERSDRRTSAFRSGSRRLGREIHSEVRPVDRLRNSG